MIADAGGELSECAGSARVAVGAEEHLAGAGVAFLRQGDVADALVARRANVVEVRQLLLGRELPQYLDVAIRHRVGGEDVVVRDDDDLLLVPDAGILAEVLLEDADGPRPAYVVGHEHVGLDPDVLAWGNLPASGVAGEDLFRQRHCGHATGSEVVSRVYQYILRNSDAGNQAADSPYRA
jgi:hypothetical protein